MIPRTRAFFRHVCTQTSRRMKNGAFWVLAAVTLLLVSVGVSLARAHTAYLRARKS